MTIEKMTHILLQKLICQKAVFKNIVTYVMVCDLDGILDWMIGFIDHLYTPLRATRNYRAIAASLVVSWQRI
jgi:hypothetical protein